MRKIFIFPRSVNHDVMVEAIYAMKNQTYGDWKRIRRKPISAGFIEAGRCVGKSESLGISSRPQDCELLPYT
jgi:hypothetical protein